MSDTFLMSEKQGRCGEFLATPVGRWGRDLAGRRLTRRAALATIRSPMPAPLVIAHSPDADDAFMFCALATGKVPAPARGVTHVLRDIETLNREAERGTYEVTALSAHQYPYVRARYRLMTVGASVGERYGPLVVAAKPTRLQDLARATIAIPGERTTAALVLRLCLPEERPVVHPFDRVGEAVRSGAVAAGVIIHEGQVTWQREGFHKVVDLGEWWAAETGGLPLPLGFNGVRRDLPEAEARAATAAIRDSIRWALDHRPEALAHALAYARGTGHALADRFVGMYVNDQTLDLGDRGRAGLAELYRRAGARKLIPDPGPIDWVGPC